MTDYDKKFKGMQVEPKNSVAFVTIKHKEMNLFDKCLIGDMIRFSHMVKADDDIGAIVFQSANPFFFIAHADVNLLLDRAKKPPHLGAGDFEEHWGSDAERHFQMMVERFRKMPKATIGKIDGIARGGGLEFLAALDMRFGSERTRLAQPELGLAFVAGGGAMTRWSRLIGTGRALELMLGCNDIDAATAAHYGMINRVIPAEGLDDFVDTIATRIASFSPSAIKAIKDVIYSEAPIEESLRLGSLAFDKSIRDPIVTEKINEFLAKGGQTPARELGPLVP